MQNTYLPAFLLLSLLLLGCIGDKELSESRLLCLDLTNPSSTGIPFCSSQDECIKEVEAHFDFDTAPFSQVVREKIAEFRNRLGRSWLYYNLSVVNINYLHAACYKGDFTAIRRQVNELSHNAITAFEESDKAHQFAFAILLMEKSDLENSDVNLVKEEPLFNDYSLITENVALLNNEKLRNISSGSFAATYFRNTEKFRAFAEKFSYNEKIIGEFTTLDFLDGLDQKVLQNIPNRPFYLPLLSKVLEGLISKTNNLISLYDAKSVLQNSPSFELLESYRSFAAPAASTSSLFSEMMRSDSNHRKELKEKADLSETELKSQLDTASEKIAAIDDSSYSLFDQNFLADLSSLLGEKSRIKNQVYEFNDFPTLKSDSLQRLSEIKSQYYSLKNSEKLGGLSFGSKISSLKNLIEQAKKLSGNISYFAYDSLDSFGVLCDEEIASIKKSAPQLSFTGIESLKAILLSDISEYEKSTGLKSKLPLCRKILLNNESALLAVKNMEEFELVQQSNLKLCISRLENLFSSQPSIFSDITPLFERLKIPGIYDESTLLQKCGLLEEKAELTFRLLPGVSIIEQNHADSLETLNKLSSASPFLPELKPKIDAFRKRISLEASYFSGNYLDILKSIKNLPELEISSGNLLYDLQSFYGENLEKINALQGIPTDSNSNLPQIQGSLPTGNSPNNSEKDTAPKLPENKKISEPPQSNPKKLLADEMTKLQASFKSMQSLAGEYGLELPENRFSETLEDVNALLNSNNIHEAGTALNDLSGIIGDMNKSLLEKAGVKVADAKLSVESMHSIIDSINEKAYLLELSLKDLNSNENYLPSTTIERIRNLKQAANDFETGELKNPLKAFEASESNDIFKALSIFQEIQSKIGNAKSKLEKIDKELGDDLDEIKLDSLSFYNKAVAKANSLPNPQFVSEYLLEAKENYGKEKYSKSLSNSLKAISLMSMANPQGFDIPLAIYPLLAVVVLVLYFRHKRKNTPQQTPVKVERIFP